MEKITKRTMFAAIIANASDMSIETEDGKVTISAQAVIDFAQNEIDLLDKKAAKAKERAATKKAEGDELTAAVQSVLTGDLQTIADIAAQIEGEDVTVAKVTYRLRTLVENGVARKEQITVAGGEGQKSRKIMAYALIED